MTEKLSDHVDELRKLPLFRGMTAEHLEQLMGLFRHSAVPAGQRLFAVGEAPSDFLLLVRGEVEIRDEHEGVFRLRPVAPIGELGTLTGLERRSTATTTLPSEVWRIGKADMFAFFEEHGDIAFPCYHNLLGIVGDKVRRDRERMALLRDNVVRTQKAMKTLREAVLAAPETDISRRVCDTLEALIEENRRAHYLVEPPAVLPCAVRLDDGSMAPVTALSDRRLVVHLASRSPEATLPSRQAEGWSAVLCLPGEEIPISGHVEALDTMHLTLLLDPMIARYESALGDYLTRVQMLDYVV